MKFPEFKKIKLSTVSTYGVVIILATAMLIIAIIAISAIRGAGSYSLKTTKEAIKKEAISLLQENTKRKAGEYSATFRETIKNTSLLAEQIFTTMNNIEHFDFPESILNKNLSDYLRKSEDAPYIKAHNHYHNWSIYWGDNIERVKIELYILKVFFPSFRTVSNTSLLYNSIWLTDFSNDIDFYCYREPKKTILSIPNKIYGLKSFYRAKHKYQTSGTEYISNIYKEVYNDFIVLTIASNFVPVSEKYKLVLGIDILFDDIARGILKHEIPYITDENKNNISFNNSFIIEKGSNEILAISKELHRKLMFEEKDISKLGHGEKLSLSLNYSKIKAARKAAEMIQNKKSGVQNIIIDGKENILCFQEMSIRDWVFGVVVPIQDLYQVAQRTEVRMKDNVLGFIVNFLMIALFFMYVLFIVVIIFFKTHLVKPLLSFRDSVIKMGQGDLDTPIEERGVYEIALLANSFDKLRFDLKNYMENFTNEATARQRRENELKTARQVQLAVLPKITPLFQQRGIKIYAKLIPAIDVAGDYYDFFYIEKNKLVLIIADVSGKGISASFFMAVTKRTLRNTCINEPDDPAKAISLANNILCSYNINMFVTLFLLYYDLETGEIQYANGGHNEAVCLRADGGIDVFGCLGNVALGCFGELPFGKSSYKLEKGDTIYLYTDGIVEANTGNEDFYGLERLQDVLFKNRDRELQEICRTVIKEVNVFENGKQFDDITILALKRID